MQKGFTLIELLGIITILGLILIVAIPMLIESNRVAKTNENEANTDNLEMAARDYASSCKSLGICVGDCADNTKNCKVDEKTLKEHGFLKNSNNNSNRTVTVTPDGSVTVN